ncbi:MAG: DUF1289 domain-containing protein [Saccharospirillaceae bacterium]|nr:DUF1289 domain-containing protein [Saccharospirillaceae bacterium]MCD8531229.1 DUF1289 domain-containing protein [Saccharospirillaceae bacterium]
MSTPVRSPCVNICALDDNDLCVGCYRSGEEISRWGRYSDDERRAVLQKVAERERDAMNYTPVPAD